MFDFNFHMNVLGEIWSEKLIDDSFTGTCCIPLSRCEWIVCRNGSCRKVFTLNGPTGSCSIPSGCFGQRIIDQKRILDQKSNEKSTDWDVSTSLFHTLLPESSAWSKRFWPWSKQKVYFINWQIDHGQNCFDHADDSGISAKFFKTCQFWSLKRP